MILPLAALGREEIADYVSALFIVYMVLILLNVLICWVPRMPYRPWLRSVLDFITDTTEPLPQPLPAAAAELPSAAASALDLSPMLAIIVLLLAQRIVVGLIRG